MKLRAPAKVNLHLTVLGRRADGFHDIETLMVPISLADEISVEVSIGRTVQVRCDDPTVPLGDANLVTRAAQVFSRETQKHFGAEISILKRIPMGAGLGGGSSDAAAVLIALDTIFETDLGVRKLEELAGRLGSDIPFFIRRAPALCEGRGEFITPFKMTKTYPLFLAKPAFSVPTVWAYKQWKDSRSLPGDFEAEQRLDDLRIVNSLERPVFEKYIFLPVLKKWLLSQPETRVAAMSGSGSTVFAVLKPEADGVALEQRARSEFGDGLWTSLCETEI